MGEVSMSTTAGLEPGFSAGHGWSTAPPFAWWAYVGASQRNGVADTRKAAEKAARAAEAELRKEARA